MEAYTIHDKAEETECDHCGYPLYTGDDAIMDYDTLKVYCSETCHELDTSTEVLLTSDILHGTMIS